MREAEPVISPVITERTKRFAAIWARQFALLLSLIALGISIGCTVGYLLIVAANAFGAKAVLIGLAVTWVLAFAAAAAGSAAESKLAAAEQQEAEVMRKLSGNGR